MYVFPRSIESRVQITAMTAAQYVQYLLGPYSYGYLNMMFICEEITISQEVPWLEFPTININLPLRDAYSTPELGIYIRSINIFQIRV
jgi:hypothetical protein